MIAPTNDCQNLRAGVQRGSGAITEGVYQLTVIHDFAREQGEGEGEGEVETRGRVKREEGKR